MSTIDQQPEDSTAAPTPEARFDNPEAVTDGPIDPAIDSPAEATPDSSYSVDAFQQFVRQAAAHRILTRREEQELAKRIERGDLDAKDTMIRHNVKLVVGISGDYHCSHLSRLDLVSEGIGGLIRASEKFDYRRGLKFSTYATWWVRQSITRAIADKDRTIRYPVKVVEEMGILKRTSDELEQQLNRLPTAEEIAEFSSLTLEQVESLQSATAEPRSLDEPAYEDGKTLQGEVIEAPGANPAKAVTDRVLREEVHAAIRDLPDLERRVIGTLYFDGTGGDIRKTARALSFPAKEVERIQISALARLRETLAGESGEGMAEYLREESERSSIDALRERVWELKQEYPDMSFVRIAERLGIHYRRANAYYHEKCAELEAAD